MVGMSHFLVPFMVFPILANLLGQPPELAKAAAIMGAGKLRVFLRVTLPLSLPGVVAGSLLVFISHPRVLHRAGPARVAQGHDAVEPRRLLCREVLDWSIGGSGRGPADGRRDDCRFPAREGARRRLHPPRERLADGAAPVPLEVGGQSVCRGDHVFLVLPSLIVIPISFGDATRSCFRAKDSR